MRNQKHKQIALCAHAITGSSVHRLCFVSLDLAAAVLDVLQGWATEEATKACTAPVSYDGCSVLLVPACPLMHAPIAGPCARTLFLTAFSMVDKAQEEVFCGFCYPCNEGGVGTHMAFAAGAKCKTLCLQAQRREGMQRRKGCRRTGLLTLVQDPSSADAPPSHTTDAQVRHKRTTNV